MTFRGQSRSIEKRTFESKLFKHSLMCIVLKFHESSSRNEEVIVILISVRATTSHPVKTLSELKKICITFLSRSFFS